MGNILRSPVRRLGAAEDVLCSGECRAIQDVKYGWEDFCLGLQLINQSTTPALCRSSCCTDPSCEVWQWGNQREQSGNSLGSCYTGRGLECSSDRFDNFLVLAGQKISRSTVSETIKLEIGRWCTGSGMRQAPHVTPLSATGTYKNSVDECQKVCYGDARCSIWEHSTTKGCWYGYSDKCAAGIEGADTMVAGERVARACGLGVSAQAPTDYVTVFGIIGAVALLLTCCATIILLIGNGGAQLFEGQGSEDGEGDDNGSARLSRETSNAGDEAPIEDFKDYKEIMPPSPLSISSGKHAPGAGGFGDPQSNFEGSSNGSTIGSFTPLLEPRLQGAQLTPQALAGQYR